MDSIERIINRYQLKAHPEGGFYRRVYSSETVTCDEKKLPLYSSIYFLLTEDSPSRFHQLSRDELWFFHQGSPLTIHELDWNGMYSQRILGKDQFQHLVPGGRIFGSSVDKGYALVSCVVVPAFDFEDFKLWSKEELMVKFPHQKDIIDFLGA